MVIQRWQSVMLLIAAVMMGCFTFCSLGQVNLNLYELNFTTLGFTVEGELTAPMPEGFPMHTWELFVVSLLSAIMPFITIFMFKNLKFQRTLCLIEVLFLLAVAALSVKYGYCSFEGAAVSWSSAIITLPIALIAVVIAYYLIGRDLLRAADRLR